MAKKVLVQCPECKENREVTYGQSWNIKTNKCSGKCHQCADGRNISGLEKGRGWNKGLECDWVKHIVHKKLLGKDNPMFGKRMSEESKELMRLAKFGRMGELANNWQGGITSQNMILRTCAKYQIWRNLVFLRDNFTCQNKNCEFCENKMGGKLHAHHIKSFAKYPELRFEVSNGTTYCEDFHLKSKLHCGLVGIN